MNEIQQEPLIQQGDLEQELEQQPTEPAMLSLPNSVGDAEHEALNESPDHVSPEEGNLEQLLKDVGNAEPEQHPDEHALVQEGGFCGGCGAPLQPDALFCNNCGHKKTREESKPTLQQHLLEEQHPPAEPTEPAMGLSLPNSVGDAEHEALNESPDHVSPEEGNLEQLLKEVGNAEPEQHPDEHALVQEGGICGGCGAPLQPAALFCNNCGQKKT